MSIGFDFGFGLGLMGLIWVFWLMGQLGFVIG